MEKSGLIFDLNLSSMLFSDKRHPCPLKFSSAFYALLLNSVFLLAGISNACASGNEDFTDRLKVAFTYKIIRFIEWPENADSDNHGPVTICVLAGKRLNRLFIDYEAKEINGRTIQASVLDQAPKSSDLCAVLYVGNSQQTHLPQILEQSRSLGKILTVSDIENFSRLGGMVEFKVHDGSVKMEINVSNATNADIRISSKLLEIANIVQRD